MKTNSVRDILDTVLRTLAVGFLAVVGSGCISADPVEDRRRAVDLAGTRLTEPLSKRILDGSAQDPPAAWNGDTPLDADTAVEVALSRDPSIRQTLAMVDMARAELAREDRAPNPVVGLNVGIPIDGISGGPALATLAQQVTWLWTRPWRIEAADAERRAAILRAASAIVDLDARIRHRHAETIAAAELAAIDRNFADITRRSMELVRKRLQAGEASQLDLDRAVVEARKAEVAADASEITARASRVELLADIGLPSSDSDFEIVGSLDRGSEPVPTEVLVVTLSATARLDVAARGMELLAAEARTGLARTRRLPEVSATLNWTRNVGDREALGPGGRISIPIFDDGTPGIAAAASKVREKMFALLETQRRAIGQARLVRERLLAARVQALGYRDRVLAPAVLAEERAELSYDEGVSDLTVLLLAQQRRINAERSAVGHELQVTLRRIDLARAVGGSLELEPVVPTIPSIEEMEQRSEQRSEQEVSG